MEKFDDKGMDYIEELIEKKRNRVLNVLLQLRPELSTGASENEPFHNRAVHMAAKYDNVDFLRELYNADSEVIDLRNGMLIIFPRYIF